MSNDDRKKLTALIEEKDGENWWKPEEFEKYIHPRLPRELTLVTQPPIYSENYNCFVFALGLEQNPEFLGGKNPIQQEFISYLLDKQLLKLTDIPEWGDLIFYEDSEGNITHGGILKTESTMLSKWMWGPVIENKLLDVPSSFGEVIFYTKPILSEEIKRQYQIYKDNGAEIKPII